jgi:ketosteroid isomerase-like protein
MPLMALAVAAVVSQAPASGGTDAPSVPLPPELARVLTDYESAWQRKDNRALAALFAEDGFVLSSGGPAVRGRSAIEAHYAGQGGPLSLRALAYSTEGSTGYIIGAYTRKKGEPDVGKFTLTLRKGADGRWLIVSDMDNGNSRPAPCPSPSGD